MPKDIDTSTIPNDPIGILPDGSLNVVRADDPLFLPIIVDDAGNIVKMGKDELANRQRAIDSHRLVYCSHPQSAAERQRIASFSRAVVMPGVSDTYWLSKLYFSGRFLLSRRPERPPFSSSIGRSLHLARDVR